MNFKIDIITLYPELFPGALASSLAGKALKENKWSLNTIYLRDFAIDKHKNVDDTPAGGGAGMILRADILAKAIDSVSTPDDQRPIIYLTPRGKPLKQAMVKDFAKQTGVIIVCGRFEGIDQRIIEKRNLIEISIGDYIVSGGEIASFVFLDSIIRLLPGVMGNSLSAESESFENNLLEYPQYTRPHCFEGENIPDILTSGHHQKIALWRQQAAEEITKERRPDLWNLYQASKNND